MKGYTRIVAEKFATMSAQLVLLANVYDALISEKYYKAAYSKEEAFHMKKVRLFMKKTNLFLSNLAYFDSKSKRCNNLL